VRNKKINRSLAGNKEKLSKKRKDLRRENGKIFLLRSCTEKLDN